MGVETYLGYEIKNNELSTFSQRADGTYYFQIDNRALLVLVADDGTNFIQAAMLDADHPFMKKFDKIKPVDKQADIDGKKEKKDKFLKFKEKNAIDYTVTTEDE